MAMSVVYTTIDRVLVHEDRGGVERQYVGDPLGSLVGELDENQNLTYTADYWPYGEVRTESGNKQSEWGFVGLLGYLKDLETLLYVRARHYLPHKSKWLTVDPLSTVTREPYAYATDPVTWNDPSGLMSNPGCHGRLAGCLARATERWENCLNLAILLCAAALSMYLLCSIACAFNPVCIFLSCMTLLRAVLFFCLGLPVMCNLQFRKDACECYREHAECLNPGCNFDFVGCVTGCPGATTYGDLLNCYINSIHPGEPPLIS